MGEGRVGGGASLERPPTRRPAEPRPRDDHAPRPFGMAAAFTSQPPPTLSSPTPAPMQKTPRIRNGHEAFPKKVAGSDLLSQGVPAQVPSALRGLTAGFGMGPGVSPSLKPPAIRDLAHESSAGRSSALKRLSTSYEDMDQASRTISTARLRRSHALHLPPIYAVVSCGPSGTLRCGRSHLEVGFPLRCFQRLSLRDIATLRCPWRDNRYTSGHSTPVLSY